MHESKDCVADDDLRMTTFCQFSYSNKKNPKQTGHGTVMGCQKSDHDNPSQATMDNMKQIAADKLRVKLADVQVEASCRAIGAWSSEMTVDELMTKKMASNCSPTFSLNDVTGHTQFSCRYLGAAPDENGVMGVNPSRTWQGRLATCSTATDSASVEGDIKKVAQQMMGGKAAGIDISKIQCTSFTRPML